MMVQNGVTVEDILKMDCMKNSQMVAGNNGRKNVITQVNVMADPDVLNWVGEGEFLLVTAYSLVDDIERQVNLIRECSQKKLAGIGIKIYPYIEKLPDKVIKLSNELNFPIIELHHATPLSDIIMPIFREIFTRQSYILQKIEGIHKQMTNAMLMGASIEDMINIVYNHLKKPVYLKLNFPEMSIFPSGERHEKIKELLIKNAEDFSESMTKRTHRNIYESRELIDANYTSRIVMPITIKNNIYGYLYEWGIDSQIEEIDTSVLESASTTIALEVLKNLSIKEVENKYRAEFLDDLLSTEDKRKEKALERASFFNLKLEKETSILLISVRETDSKFKNIIQDDKQESITKIVHFLERVINDLSLTGVVAGKTESIILLLSFKKEDNIQYLTKQIVRKLSCVFERKFSDIKFKIGVGRNYDKLYDAYKSYKDAQEAIASGDIVNEGDVIYFENLGIYKILCQENLREEIEKFYKVNLENLVEYDSKKSTELVKTLEAYFQHNGNLKKMSDSLFTHYNTILYRLSRIKEITGMNLENAKDRLNLEIALKIKLLLNK